MVQPIHNIVVMLIPQHQNCTVAPNLPQCWIETLTHDVLWILYWQICCNVEAETSNSQSLYNADIITLKSQRCTNTASTSDSKFNSQHIMNVVIVKS